MSTDHALPWDDAQWMGFLVSLNAIRNLELSPEMKHVIGNIDTLQWRHWIIAFAVRYARRFTGTAQPTMVECGVGDGLSAFIALREQPGSMHLYDTWAPMRGEDLTEAESWLDGHYAGLSIERTRRNLAGFLHALTWHVGHIPETFGEDAPGVVHYLHIDINNALATTEALDFFLPRLHPRAAVLFDDYGHVQYFETKRAIDRALAEQPGLLLKLPTGQAIYLHCG